jgi:hypothetical protein
MKDLLIVATAAILFTSCNSGNNSKTAATFCDTTCTNDAFQFQGDNPKLKQTLTITMKNCTPDSVSWTYEGLDSKRHALFNDYTPQDVRLNKSALAVVYGSPSMTASQEEDTWLNFLTEVAKAPSKHPQP